MAISALGIAGLLAVAWLIMPGSVTPGARPLAAIAADQRLAPVPVGPPAVVTTELAYAAFPVTIRLADGSYLMSYGVNTSHYGVTGRAWLRRSLDGRTWSDSWSPSGQTAGYGWGVTGLAQDPASGRIWAGVVRTGWVTGTQELASVAGYVRYSDDRGGTWSALAALPGAGANPGGWSLYPSGMAWDGDHVLLSGYGADHLTRFVAITGDGTLAPGQSLAAAGRQLQEPELCPMGDGRMAVVMRSDGIAPDGSQRLYAAVRPAGSATFGAPAVITYDGSGAPSCAEVAPGVIAIAYRGWIDRADATRRPARVLMYSPAGYGRGNIDLGLGVYGRFLYGSWVPGANGDWLLVFAAEGPNGSTAASAQVWTIPVRFTQIPS
jgi:hypothetical protein